MAHKRAGYTEEKHQQGGGGYGAKYDERDMRGCRGAQFAEPKERQERAARSACRLQGELHEAVRVCLRRIEKGKTERPDARNVDGDKRDEKDGALGQALRCSAAAPTASAAAQVTSVAVPSNVGERPAR